MVGLACLATCSATMASVGLSGMLPACDCAPHSPSAQRRIADSHAGAGCAAKGIVGACLIAHLLPGLLPGLRSHVISYKHPIPDGLLCTKHASKHKMHDKQTSPDSACTPSSPQLAYPALILATLHAQATRVIVSHAHISHACCSSRCLKPAFDACKAEGAWVCMQGQALTVIAAM